MNTNLWIIQAQTNLHVGNESTSNYGLIDKAIQRDSLTKLPCINSSSLKGAINEYCCRQDEKGNDIVMDAKIREYIFGSDKKAKKDNTNKGKAIFYDAKLLFLPMQTDDANLYQYITSNRVLDLFEERMKLFQLDFSIDRKALQEKFRLERPVKVDDEKFVCLCSDDELPIIARNRLENGTSDNLWYEQVLPAKTVLYTITQEPKEFLKTSIINALIQIGANATIGYGYCKFTNLK